jgi:ATP-dependent exoDNAse (exonuclease V) beta subunit
VTFEAEDGGRLEGVVDLAFLEAGTWHVIDFKTDADVRSRIEHYAVQVGWYTHAMARLTGVPARGYLLRV